VLQLCQCIHFSVNIIIFMLINFNNIICLLIWIFLTNFYNSWPPFINEFHYPIVLHIWFIIKKILKELFISPLLLLFNRSSIVVMIDFIAAIVAIAAPIVINLIMIGLIINFIMTFNYPWKMYFCLFDF